MEEGREMSETTLTNDDEPRRGQGETSVIFYLPLLWERNENRRWCVNRQTGDSALRQAISL